jgi:hypothetical protein
MAGFSVFYFLKGIEQVIPVCLRLEKIGGLVFYFLNSDLYFFILISGLKSFEKIVRLRRASSPNPFVTRISPKEGPVEKYKNQL